MNITCNTQVCRHIKNLPTKKPLGMKSPDSQGSSHKTTQVIMQKERKKKKKRERSEANSMLLWVENTTIVYQAQVHNQNSQSSQSKLEKCGMQKSTQHAFCAQCVQCLWSGQFQLLHDIQCSWH